MVDCQQPWREKLMHATNTSKTIHGTSTLFEGLLRIAAPPRAGREFFHVTAACPHFSIWHFADVHKQVAEACCGSTGGSNNRSSRIKQASHRNQEFLRGRNIAQIADWKSLQSWLPKHVKTLYRGRLNAKLMLYLRLWQIRFQHQHKAA